MEKAAEALVNKLELIHEDPKFQSVWIMAHNRGCPYDGPTYEKELNDLKTALKG